MRFKRMRATWIGVAAVGWLASSSAWGQGDSRSRMEAELKLTVGIAYLNNDEPREALTRLEEAIALDPQNGTARFLAATALNRLGRYQEALPHLQQARELKAEAPPGRIAWFEGEALYWLGRFDEAAAKFEEAIRADAQDAYAHFYYGLTLLNLKRGKESAAELERAVALDESLGATSAYYAGKAFFAQGDLDKAKAEFEKAMKSEGSDNLKKASGNYLQVSEASRPAAGPPRGELRIGYALESDDNVILLADDSALRDAVLEGSTSEIGDEGDTRQTLQVRGAVYPFYDAAGWSMGLVLNTYHSVHADLGIFDIGAPQGVISFIWGKDPQGSMSGPITSARIPTGASPVLFAVQYGFSYYNLDKESFLRTSEAGVSLKIPEGKWTSTQIDVDHRDNTFFQIAARTGTYSQARLIQSFYLGRREYALRVGLRAATTDSDNIDEDASTFTSEELVEQGGVSDDFDSDEAEIFADVSLALPHRVALFFQASFLNQEFDNIHHSASFSIPNPTVPGPADPDLDELREDDQIVLSATAVYGFSKHWSLLGRYTFNNHDSNKTIYEYDRSVASVGVSWYY